VKVSAQLRLVAESDYPHIDCRLTSGFRPEELSSIAVTEEDYRRIQPLGRRQSTDGFYD
jgi:hypothetical protein